MKTVEPPLLAGDLDDILARTHDQLMYESLSQIWGYTPFLSPGSAVCKDVAAAERELLSKSFVQSLCDGLSRPDPRVRRVACKILCRMGTCSLSFFRLLSRTFGEAFCNNSVSFSKTSAR